MSTRIGCAMRRASTRITGRRWPIRSGRARCTATTARRRTGSSAGKVRCSGPLMEGGHMTRPIEITVKRSARNSWEVCESGFEAPLAEFADREDAIEYARGIAATKSRASVDAEPDADLPGVRESYALDPVSGKSHRLTA